MQKHTKIFFNHHGYGEQDTIMCQYCRCRVAVDIHHIEFKSQGGKDEITNLIALCRPDHEAAHRKTIKAEELKSIVTASLNA